MYVVIGVTYLRTCLPRAQSLLLVLNYLEVTQVTKMPTMGIDMLSDLTVSGRLSEEMLIKAVHRC